MLNKYLNKLVLGNCLNTLKNIPDNSLDLLCTDPPYGISFMGKNWDKALPSVEIWKECLRVLKPGAFGFVMSLPRQDVLSRMIINLEDAGFNTNFTSIFWSYATGFPKAQNMSKVVDKKLGLERKIIGKAKGHTGKQVNMHLGVHDDDNYEWLGIYDITVPTSEQAKDLDGSYAGFQPKPAVEVILVVMKPLDEKTYVEQAMKNGKGITWFDDCRIPKPNGDRTEYGVDGDEESSTGNENTVAYGKYNRVAYNPNEQGRFPANLLVSDDVLNDGNITMGRGGNKSGKTALFDNAKEVKPIIRLNDSGSFSRYFDLDSWWEKKLQELGKSAEKTFPFLIVPKASKSEKNKGCNDLEAKLSAGLPLRKAGGERKGIGGDGRKSDRVTTKKNFHPTVKPLKLMSYLIILGSRPDDIVLDPFIGSGTTAMASKMLKRNYIGIDLNREYLQIALKRLQAIK